MKKVIETPMVILICRRCGKESPLFKAQFIDDHGCQYINGCPEEWVALEAESRVANFIYGLCPIHRFSPPPRNEEERQRFIEAFRKGRGETPWEINGSKQ